MKIKTCPRFFTDGRNEKMNLVLLAQDFSRAFFAQFPGRSSLIPREAPQGAAGCRIGHEHSPIKETRR